MFLIIYERKGELFHNFAEKVKGRFKVYTDKFKAYTLNKKDIKEVFKVESWSDFWKLKEELKKYKLQILITRVVYKDKTEIGLTVLLLNNIIRKVLLKTKDKGDDSLADDDCKPSLYEIKTKQDWLDAEKEFEFECDLKDKIF